MPPEQHNHAFKGCKCGASFNRKEWQELPLTTRHGGRLKYADGFTYEFRQCNSCGSTLACTVGHPTPAPRPAVRPPSQPPQDVAASAMLRVSSRTK